MPELQDAVSDGVRLIKSRVNWLCAEMPPAEFGRNQQDFFLTPAKKILECGKIILECGKKILECKKGGGKIILGRGKTFYTHGKTSRTHGKTFYARGKTSRTCRKTSRNSGKIFPALRIFCRILMKIILTVKGSNA